MESMVEPFLKNKFVLEWGVFWVAYACSAKNTLFFTEHLRMTASAFLKVHYQVWDHFWHKKASFFKIKNHLQTNHIVFSPYCKNLSIKPNNIYI